jgi:hypothetical protein
MKNGLKIFALCLVAALQTIGAAQSPQKKLEAKEVIRRADKYVYMIHGYWATRTARELILEYGDTRMVTVAADRRADVEDFIDAGFEVWTSEDSNSSMRMDSQRTVIIVDDKYIVDHLGNVTEDQQSAFQLARTVNRFFRVCAKIQKPRPKKKSPPAKK